MALEALKKDADLHFIQGRLEQAYGAYLELSKKEPENEFYRIRLADVCVSLHRSGDALRILKHLSAHLIQQGKVIQAIHICKRILELDPKDQAIKKNLELLYAKSADQSGEAQKQARSRVEELAKASLQMPNDALELAEPGDKVTLSAQEMSSGPGQGKRKGKNEPPVNISSGLELAEPWPVRDHSISGADGFRDLSLSQSRYTDLSLASSWRQDGGYPEIPLFSDLPRGAFSKVIDEFVRKTFPPRNVILNQGDRGNAIFIVAAGHVEIERTVGKKRMSVATLNPGDFFGEFAYFARSRREATVTSVDTVELLELSRESMDQIIMEFPKVKDAMQKLYRKRVLANLLTDSPLFGQLDLAGRQKFLELFMFREVQPGKTIFKEGEASESFYVVQSGKVQVMKGGKALAQLGPGDFFGEYGALTGAARTASVQSVELTELAIVHRDALLSIFEGRTVMIETMKKIAKERLAAQQQIT